MMKKLRQIISLVLVLVMFFDYGAVSASYEPASYAVAAVAGLEELIQSTEPEEIQGEEAEAAEAPDLAELPEQPEDAQPGEAPEDAQQSEDPDALLQAERVSPLTGLLNQVSRISAPYRDDGYIHIYNYYMLSLIGTGLPVEAEDVFHGYADNREADAPEAPDWGEEPEEPAQAEQPEQPAEAEEPEQPAEAEQPEQPAEVEEPEQPAEVEQPEQPAEPEQPEQPAEPDEPEQIAAPEASALPEVPEQIGETLLTQALGRALSRVLVRDTAAPQRAVTATLAAAVAEVTGEEAAPQELAEEDAPAELQGEAQPETDPDPMTDPAQTAAEPALPVAAGESAPDDSDTLPTDAEPAPDAVPAQDSEEPEAPAATGTSPTEPDADTDTYYNNDENNEEPAPAAEPAEPEEIAEPEDGEAAPPAAQPELIDDPDVVEGPETGDLSQQPDEPVDEPTDAPDEGTALTESKYYYYPNGELVRYTSDAKYYLECDIPLPKENCWTLPEDFTGSFSGRVRPGDAERVYDPETDTVFIHNPLQLQLLNSPNHENEPVMTGDIDVNTFGTGKLVFKDGSRGDAMLSGDGDPASYKNGVISTDFNTRGPTRGAANDGRASAGQVTIVIDGVTYILIGNRQQLDAIQRDDGREGTLLNPSTRVKVYGPSTDGTGYPGDADVGAKKNLYGINTSGYSGAVDTGLYYTKDANYIVFRDIDMRVNASFDESATTNLDDLPAGLNWQPLMFSGKMYGVLALDEGDTIAAGMATLLSGGSLSESERPTISYTKVVPYIASDTTTKKNCVDYSKHFGIGFFATIGESQGFLKRNSPTLENPSVVKNLNLQHVLVMPGVDEGVLLNARDSGVEGLISLLTGAVVGPLLDTLLTPILNGLIGPNSDIKISLTSLLDVNKVDAVGLATGAFAGVISGNAKVEDCAVSCASVNTAVTAYEQGGGRPKRDGRVIVGKGGFVGQIQGLGVYGGSVNTENDAARVLAELLSGLFNVVNTITDALSAILNILSVVGLDLGNVVRLLTHNLLNVGLAIPTDYRSPTVKNCAADRIVLSDQNGKYGVGGFAGSVVGAVVEDSAVTNCDYLVVNADKFGGGFAGVVRDDMVANLLSGLGIVFGGGATNSALLECEILDSDITVTGGGSLGGFVGMMASSHALNCGSDKKSRLVVQADRIGALEQGEQDNGDYVGGFVGHVSVGSNMSASDHLDGGSDLIGTVVSLLTSLLQSGDNGSLLDLSVSNSHSGIMGCQLLGATEVRATQGKENNYVGGMIGFGEAPYATASTLENIKKLKMYKQASGSPVSKAQCNVVWNLVDVSSGGNYVGGLAGGLSFASGAGALGNTLGVGRMAEFILTHTTVRGISLEDYQWYYSGARTTAPYTNETYKQGYNDEDDIGKQIYQNCADHESWYDLTGNTHFISDAHGYEGNGVKGGQFVGCALGMARGGTVDDIAVCRVHRVSGDNYIGGFAGATGPGDLVGGDGIGLQLLGLNLLNISNLLSLAGSVKTEIGSITVSGSGDGLEVEATGDGDTSLQGIQVIAGGFVAVANSTVFNDCHVKNLKYVKASRKNGAAGGFVGQSGIGGGLLSAAGEGQAAGNVIELKNLLDAAPYLVPEFNGCDVYFANNGYVDAWCAGGFAGEFQSGFVNKHTNRDEDGNPRTKIVDPETGAVSYLYRAAGAECGCNHPGTHGGLHDGDCACCCCDAKDNVFSTGIPENPWSVYNLGYVRGGMYAGGWGGHVYPGALAGAADGLNIAGMKGVSLSGLLGLVEAYVPMIQYAGVKSSNETHLSEGQIAQNNGFAVYAADDSTVAAGKPATGGYAGGYIGQATGAQISYCDVTYLKSGTIYRPDYLEAVNGHEYMEDDNFHFGNNGIDPLNMEYAVAGAEYAGGYIGRMDVGSTASLGDNLGVLGSVLSLNSILSALNLMVPTVEHSDVVGAPGGFNIIASPRINNPQGHYGKDEYAGSVDAILKNYGDGEGMAYAGGFVAQLSGGHIQESNVSNFEHIIGEVAAGGYVGEMEPGSVADLAGQGGVLGRVANLSNLASLLNDFIPTIRNSQTTCVPCGGVVRAQSPSDRGDHLKDSVTMEIRSRGFAGGYVGHMVGGQIWGFSTEPWQSQISSDVKAIYDERVAVDGDEGIPLISPKDPHQLKVKVYMGYDEYGNELVDADGRPIYVYTFIKDNVTYIDGNDLTGDLKTYFDSGAYFTAEKNELTGTITYSPYTIVYSKKEDTNNPGNYVDDLTNPINTPKDLNKVEYWMVFDTDSGTVKVRDYHKYGTLNVAGEVSEPMRQCAAIRILSVYGHEYAGGYCGRMESGSQVDTGNISLLGSLVDVSNVLSALEVSYSTIRFAYVNGPLRGGDDWEYSVETVDRRAFEPLDKGIFKIWYRYIGQYGGLGFYGLPANLDAMSDDEYEAWVNQWIYGTNVRAGRGSYTTAHPAAEDTGTDPDTGVDYLKDGYETYDAVSLSMSGCAGGFVGSMWSGVICDSESVDSNHILAMRSAGGFAGEMDTKGLADAGTINLLGGLIPVNLGSTLSIGDVLVPSIARSGVTGYQRGLKVEATGDPNEVKTRTNGTLELQRATLGNAGGYVGQSYGGQIGLPDEDAYGNSIPAVDRDEAYRQMHPYYPNDPVDGTSKKFDEWFMYPTPNTATNPETWPVVQYEERGIGSNKKQFSITPGATIWVNNLVTVKGSYAVGGFVGACHSGSVLGADTSETTSGPLQSLLNSVLSNPSQLLSVLEATQATIKNTVVNAMPRDSRLSDTEDEYLNVDPLSEDSDVTHLYDDYGIVVNGIYTYPNGKEVTAVYGGGFAGLLEATVVGERYRKDAPYKTSQVPDQNVVNKLRSVVANEYAGGFFGKADTGDLANVGGGDGGGGISVLQLVNAGNVTVLDAFRTYVYCSEVNGVRSGLRILAREKELMAANGSNYVYSGAAGGFAGWMNNGTIEHSSVDNLNRVEAKNYAAGFIGYMGKNEAVNAEGITIDNNDQNGLLTILNLLPGVGTLVDTLLTSSANLRALSIVGGQIRHCHVKGYGEDIAQVFTGQEHDSSNRGFDVVTTNKQTAVAGGQNGVVGSGIQYVTGAISAGFAGYADLTEIEDCSVERLKKVTSQQIAAGFLGRGTRASLVDADIDNELVTVLLTVLGFLLFQVLHIDDLSRLQLINLDGFKYLGLKLLAGDDLLMLNLGGLRIGVQLGTPTGDGYHNVTIRIGSSTINVKFNGNGQPVVGDSSAISLNLFEANRTTVRHCSVVGVVDGYDVHGDGYLEVDADGDGLDNDDSGIRNNDVWGFAGGFVGYHESSFFSHNEMVYCDVVAGSKSSAKFQENGYYTTAMKVGPFTGGFNANANTGDRFITYFEGNNNENLYHIYRNITPKVKSVNLASGGTLSGTEDRKLPELIRYNVVHRVDGPRLVAVYDEPKPKDWESLSAAEQYDWETAHLVSGTSYNGVLNFSNNLLKETFHLGSTVLGATYLKDATYTGFDVKLDGYISDGKALLMEGKILAENTPHAVLPPAELNNPCDDIELTLVKEWDHGSNPRENWPQSVVFYVNQIVTHDPNRQLIVEGAVLPEPINDPNYPNGYPYRLTMADALVIGGDVIETTWTRTYAEQEGAPSGDWRVWGTDADLPDVIDPATNQPVTGPKVFQAVVTNPNEVALGAPPSYALKMENGKPVPAVGGNNGLVLYYKSNYPEKFLAAEEVDLFYRDNGEYLPAYVYSTDSDGYLTNANGAFNGAGVSVSLNGVDYRYFVDAATGDEFWVDDTNQILRQYRFHERDVAANTITVTFDDAGAVTAVTETIGATDTQLAPANGFYTTAGGTVFHVSYDKQTAQLELDYATAGVDPTDARVVRVKKLGDEFFGYDVDNNLTHYKDYSRNIDLVFTDAELGGDVQRTGTFAGEDWLFTYSADNQQVTVYYPLKDKTVFTDPQYSNIVFEEKKGEAVFGLDAFARPTVFRYTNPDNHETIGGTVQDNTINSSTTRYTTRYDAANRELSIYNIPLTDLSEDANYAYRDERNGGKDILWMDEDYHVLKYRHYSSENANNYVDVFYNADGSFESAVEHQGATTVNLEQAAGNPEVLIRKTAPKIPVAVVKYDLANDVIEADYDTPALRWNGNNAFNAATSAVYGETEDSTHGRHTFYYNVDGVLVHYEFEDTDGYRYSTGNTAIPLTAGVAQAGGNVYATSGSNQKRLDWKYVAPSGDDAGEFTMVYDLSNEVISNVDLRWPVAYVRSPSPTSQDRMYFDIDGNPVWYQYHLEESTLYDHWIFFKINADGTLSNTAYHVRESKVTGNKDFRTSVTIGSNGIFVDPAHSGGLFSSTVYHAVVYDSAKKELKVYRDVGETQIQKTSYSIGDETSTFTLDGDGNVVSYKLDHDATFDRNKWNCLLTVDPINGTVSKGNSASPYVDGVLDASSLPAGGVSKKLVYHYVPADPANTDNPNNRLVVWFDTDTSAAFWPNNASDGSSVAFLAGKNSGDKYMLVGYDLDGRVRYVEAQDKYLSDLYKFKFYLDEHGSIYDSTSHPNLQPIITVAGSDDTSNWELLSPSDSLGTKNWTFMVSNGQVQVAYDPTDLATTQTIKGTSYALAYPNIPDTESSLKMNPSPELGTELAAAAQQKVYAGTAQPNYYAQVPYPSNTVRMHFVTPPTATQVHKLGWVVLGVGEYEWAREGIYYQYVVGEYANNGSGQDSSGVNPQGLSSKNTARTPSATLLSATHARQLSQTVLGVGEYLLKGYKHVRTDINLETSTVTISNKALEYSLGIDKFESGDRSQKLAGAEFVLFRYPTAAELGTEVGYALTPIIDGGQLVGEHLTGVERKTDAIYGETLTMRYVTEDSVTFQRGNGDFLYATEGGDLGWTGPEQRGFKWWVRWTDNGTVQITNSDWTGIMLLQYKDGSFSTVSSLDMQGKDKDTTITEMLLYRVDGTQLTPMVGMPAHESQVTIYSLSGNRMLNSSLSGAEPTFYSNVTTLTNDRLYVTSVGGGYTFQLNDQNGMYLTAGEDGGLGFEDIADWENATPEMQNSATWTLQRVDDGDWLVLNTNSQGTVALLYDGGFKTAAYPPVFDQEMSETEKREELETFHHRFYQQNGGRADELKSEPGDGSKVVLYHASHYNTERKRLYYTNDAASNSAGRVLNQNPILNPQDNYSETEKLAGGPVKVNNKTLKLNLSMSLLNVTKSGDKYYFSAVSTSPDGLNENEYYLTRYLGGVRFRPNLSADAAWNVQADQANAGCWRIVEPGDDGVALIYDNGFTTRANVKNDDPVIRMQFFGKGNSLVKNLLTEEKDIKDQVLIYHPITQDKQTIIFQPRLKKAMRASTDKDGYAEFPNPPAGTYYLQEMKAPKDYKRRTDLIKVVIGGYNEDHDDIVITHPEEEYYVAHIPNYPATTLPATGGEGAAWMLPTAGALLLLCGAYLIYNALRKRREETDYPGA